MNNVLHEQEFFQHANCSMRANSLQLLATINLLSVLLHGRGWPFSGALFHFQLFGSLHP